MDRIAFQSPPSLPAPFYQQQLGAAYLGDSIQLMKSLEAESINLILTLSDKITLVCQDSIDCLRTAHDTCKVAQ